VATGDIFQLKDLQARNGSGEVIMNSYFFRQTSATGTAQDLAEAFDGDWLTAIRGIQADAIQHRSIEVTNLFTVDDFGDVGFDDGARRGVYVGEMFPIFDSVTFRLVRTSRAVRNGYKRIAGIPETAAVSGIIGNPDYITALAVVSNLFKGSVESDDASMTWDHIVLKRNRTGAGTALDPYRYHLPTTLVGAIYSNPSACLVNLFITHQTSRGN